jgi:signal transduction histidine kinase/ABC-type nitrate/sulfonate/bicarbonate transport system substrate-binding protein
MNYFFKLIIILILFTQSLTAITEVKKVTLQLSWFNQFQFAGYYIAKEKGFYKELGLDVDIKPFQFGIDIPKEVNDNTIDFAVGRETLILERANHKNIVALYALFQASPLVLLSTQESKINSISDFKHKKVMTTIDDANEVSVKAMISSHKVSLDNLNILKHTHNINDLITKKTDVISAYISKAPFVLQKKGIRYNLFEPKEYGFDMYSDILYTSERLISNDINVVKAFKKASLMGWNYAYANIKESVDLIYEKYNTQNLSKEELLYEAKELKKLSYYNTKLLGTIDKNKLKRITDLYNVMGLLNNKIDINKFIYTENNNNSKFTSKEQKYLKNKKEITMCIDPDWMPFEKNDNGKHIGMTADYFKLFEKSISVPIRMIPTKTWSQSLELAYKKECDILSLLMKTPQRGKFLDFTQPYLKTPLVIATNNGANFMSNLSEVRDKKIGIVKDYAYAQLLKTKNPQMHFIDVNNIKNGLDKVEREELFAFIGGLATVGFEIQNNYIGQLKISGKLDNILELGIGTRNDEPMLKSIFNKVISEISTEEHQNILNKWVSINYQQGVQYQTIWRYLIIIIIVSITFILIYRQYLLKDLNKILNTKVQIEIEKNMKQNEILSQQSKMAALGEMIGNIAHQWRQPLSAISTGASGMKLQKEYDLLSDENFNKTCDSINDNAQYLSKTIDDFSNFIKGDRTKTIFNLTDNMNSFLHLVEGTIKNNNISIILDLEDDVKINGYENELTQCFINIFNNAKDALLEKKIDDKFIFISTSLINDKAIIKIKDTAKGIEKNILTKIFEPYFTTKHNNQGTGLGLHMSYNLIVDGMGGEIEVNNVEYEYNSEKYTGAEFTITLPIN